MSWSRGCIAPVGLASNSVSGLTYLRSISLLETALNANKKKAAGNRTTILTIPHSARGYLDLGNLYVTKYVGGDGTSGKMASRKPPKTKKRGGQCRTPNQNKLLLKLDTCELMLEISPSVLALPDTFFANGGMVIRCLARISKTDGVDLYLLAVSVPNENDFKPVLDLEEFCNDDASVINGRGRPAFKGAFEISPV